MKKMCGRTKADARIQFQRLMLMVSKWLVRRENIKHKREMKKKILSNIHPFYAKFQQHQTAHTSSSYPHTHTHTPYTVRSNGSCMLWNAIPMIHIARSSHDYRYVRFARSKRNRTPKKHVERIPARELMKSMASRRALAMPGHTGTF